MLAGTWLMLAGPLRISPASSYAGRLPATISRMRPSTLMRKATKTAATAIAHVLAQAIGLLSLALIFAGIFLVVAGALWR
jgi:hypothetical protein